MGFDKELREKVLLYDFTTESLRARNRLLAVEQTVGKSEQGRFRVNATYAAAMTHKVFPVRAHRRSARPPR